MSKRHIQIKRIFSKWVNKQTIKIGQHYWKSTMFFACIIAHINRFKQLKMETNELRIEEMFVSLFLHKSMSLFHTFHSLYFCLNCLFVSIFLLLLVVLFIELCQWRNRVFVRVTNESKMKGVSGLISIISPGTISHLTL